MTGTITTDTASAPEAPQTPEPEARRRPGPLRFEGRMLAPGVVLLAPLSLVPLVFILVMSLSSVHLLGGVRFDFAGLSNWGRLFTDPDVGLAWLRALAYFVLTVGLEMLLGTGIGLCLWRLLRGRNLALSLAILPMFVAPVFVGLLGRFLTDSTFGLYAWALRGLGVEGDVMGSAGSAFAAVVLMDVWEWTPLVTMIVLAGLSSVPAAVREAANLDGANGWQMLRYVVFPSISNVVLVALLIRSMDAVRYFDIIWVTTNGGPADATKTTPVRLYEVAFRFFDLGYAAAIGLLMLAVSILIARMFIRLLDTKGVAR